MAAMTGKQNARSQEDLRRFANAVLRIGQIRTESGLYRHVVAEAANILRAQRVMLVLEASDPAAADMRIAGSRLPKDENKPALLRAITPWLQEARQTHASRLRHGPAGAKAADQRSCLVAPLLAEGELLGYLYADVEGKLGRFTEGHHERLTSLASHTNSRLSTASSRAWRNGLGSRPSSPWSATSCAKC
jgi:hypothetical protein